MGKGGKGGGSKGALAQLRTRLQAFLEIIG